MKMVIPPIKSQGIKTKLVPWIKSIVPNADGKWVEPFLGTGIVALNMGFDKAILNDINPHIIKLYKSIKDNTITPEILRTFLRMEGDKLRNADEDGYEHFRFIKNRFNNDFSSLDFIFLSRAGFNGMMRFNKQGKWNIPFCKKPNRFAQAYITKIVNQLIHTRRQIKEDWIFYNIDFSDIIPMASENDIIYCDPPYFGRYVDYYNGWTEEDEEKLYYLLRDTRAKFILSTWHHNDFRENAMIDRYWSDFNIITKDHFYHSGGKIENRNKIVEALVCNYELDSSIKKHNHEAKEQSIQASFLELEGFEVQQLSRNG